VLIMAFAHVNSRNVAKSTNTLLICAAVRWNNCLLSYYIVIYGASQGSCLSPFLFNLYINSMVVKLRLQASGCHVSNVFLGCLFYSDHMLFMSASVAGLQQLLDVCAATVLALKFTFNYQKSKCIVFESNHVNPISDMCLGADSIK
jgi:Reverse transcriptase (RNA-dependent DNA polymerase)